MSDPLINPTPLPTPGQTPNWGRQLINSIRDRTDPLRQLVTQGRLAPSVLEATIGNVVEAKAGNVPTFGTQAEAVAWEAEHPGQVALWFDAGYTEVTAAGPTWTDNPLGGGTWSTPTVPGVIYTPASGTAEPGQEVTVTATAAPGYALLGTRSWTHAFPVAPPPSSYFTTFAEYTAGQKPADWTPHYLELDSWRVIAAADATGGKALTSVPSGPNRRALTWDDVLAAVDTTNVEIVARVRSPYAGSQVGPALTLRATGADATRTAHYFAVTNQGGVTPHVLRMFTFNNGVYSGLADGDPFPLVANQWYWLRFRAEAQMLYGRAWKDGDPEPTTWGLEAPAVIFAGGAVGVQALNELGHQWDVVGIATGGATAPKGA